MLVKRDWTVGQKVRGYGIVNEYGEFEFHPEETGSRAGQIKLVTKQENYTLSHSKKLVIIHITLERGSRLQVLEKFIKLTSSIIMTLKKYEL